MPSVGNNPSTRIRYPRGVDPNTASLDMQELGYVIDGQGDVGNWVENVDNPVTFYLWQQSEMESSS